MPTYNHFTELPVWQQAHAFILRIYDLTTTLKFKHDIALKDQIRRAAVSITSNIAEGHDRDSIQSNKYFLKIAKASSSEVYNQLILSKDLKYITIQDFKSMELQIISINKQLGGYINYLEKCSRN